MEEAVLDQGVAEIKEEGKNTAISDVASKMWFVYQ